MSESSDEQHPDLFGLLRGELSNAGVSRVADHLDTCQVCREELAEVAVGHALLAGTTRTLTRPPAVEMTEPQSAAPAAPPPRWRRPALLLAAAAVLIGGSATITTLLDEDPRPPVSQGEPDPSPTPEPEQQAVLEPVEGNGEGRVLMAGDEGPTTTMTIETHNLPEPRRGQYYYVWLFDPATNKMLPVGQIGPDGSATFRLRVSQLGRYSAIDVSLEADDGDPGHSVTSVLRATYA